MLSTSPKNNRAFRTPRRIVESDFAFFETRSRLLQLTHFDKWKSNSPGVESLRTIPKFKKRNGLFSCWEKDPSTWKTLEGGSSSARTICFLYSVYMQWVLLVPSARIFLCWTILAPCHEDPGTRDKSDKNGGGSFTGSSRQWRLTISFGVTTNWLLW